MRSVWLPCFLLLLGALCAGAQDPGDEARRHFQAAREAQEQGRMDEAAREYLAVLRLQPDTAEVYGNLGLVYYLDSRFQESALALEKALALKPGLRGSHLFLGIDYARLRQPQRAVPHLKQAVLEEPANKDAHSWLAAALWDAGRSLEAVRQLRTAARRLPSDPDILFLLGEAYGKAAKQDFEAVTAGSSGQPLYHQVFGDVYRNQQNWQRAVRHYRRAGELDPRWTGAHFGLAEVSFRQEKFEDAGNEYHAELKVDPSSAAARSRLAEIAILNGDAEAALRILGDAVRTAPEQAADALGLPALLAGETEAGISEATRERYRKSLPALEAAAPGPAQSLAIAAVCLRIGQEDKLREAWRQFESATGRPAPAAPSFQRALRDFDRHDFESAEGALTNTLAADPKNLRARYLRFQTFQQLSLSVLQRLLALAPDSYRAHQLLAQAHERREADAKALEEYRIVARMRPDLPGVHFSLGQLLWKTGETEQALAELGKELTLDPAHAEASAEMGMILVAQHDEARAIPFLRKALELKPGLTLAHHQLGKAYYQRREFAASERELKAALAGDSDGSIHYLLSVVARELGKAAEAKAALEESRRIRAERLAGTRIDPVEEAQP